MKKLICKTAITVLILFISSSLALSQVTVEKKLNKTFKTNTALIMSVDNKFGDINLEHWQRNELSVEVIISVKTGNKDKAEELLALINIKVTEKSDLINMITEIDDKVTKYFQKRNNKDKDDYKIHYFIKHPIYQKFDLNNSFGNINIDELQGKSNINLRFGNLKAIALNYDESKPLSEIKLSYSTSHIEKCTWVNFNVKYSSLTVNNSSALIIISRYSSLKGKYSHSLVIDSKYDSYNFSSLKNLVFNAQYSKFSSSLIENQIVADIRFTDFKIKTVPASFDNISVESRYGDVKIGINPDACYNLKANVSYGKIKIKEKANLRSEKTNTKESLEGIVGCTNNQKPRSNVTISSQYADINL